MADQKIELGLVEGEPRVLDTTNGVTLDPMLLLNDPAAMRKLLLCYAEKVLALQEQNRALASASRVAPTAMDIERETGTSPLNFRVSEGFRRQFRIYAAKNDLQLSQVLALAFEALQQQSTDE